MSDYNTNYSSGYGGAGSGAGAGGGDIPPPSQHQPSRKLQQTQAQVDEVVNIMRVNVDRVLERDQKLSELDDRATALTVRNCIFTHALCDCLKHGRPRLPKSRAVGQERER